MEPVASGISIVTRRKDSRRVIILSTILFLFLLLLVQNGRITLSILSLDSLPLGKKILFAVGAFFTIEDKYTGGMLIFALLGSLLSAINFSLAYTYMRLRGVRIVQSDLSGRINLLSAFLGVGFAACGIALLSVVLGFFGLSAMLSYLPYEGQEIGYIGIIILILATYELTRKVAEQNVC